MELILQKSDNSAVEENSL